MPASRADGNVSSMVGQAVWIRVLPYAAVALLAGAATPSAFAGVAHRRAFVVAGGGTRTPAEGVVATDASLRITHLTALADGSVAFVQQEEEADELFTVGRDGRLHALPLPAVTVSTFVGTQLARVDDLDARADGTLVIALDDRVWELAPGGAAWQTLPAFAAGP